mmetsp:Transcript_788/g.2167  ORF Transcript_788/g.2167 Transcript_788/m.2167 type:complete len:664 (-) Transcript_788:182-2173(-)
MNFQVESHHDDDDAGTGRIHPCCACCAGILLILIAPIVIWHTEGDYVKTLAALEAAGKNAIVPCDATCTQCSYSNVKTGSLIYLACPLENLKTLTDIQKEGLFSPKELEPAVAGDEMAASFSWELEMYQLSQDGSSSMGVTVDCPEGVFQSTEAAKNRICCTDPGSAGKRKFESYYYGVDRPCQPSKPRPPTKSFLQELVILDEVPDDVALSKVNSSTFAERSRRLRRDDDDKKPDTHVTCTYPCRHWRKDWSTTFERGPRDWTHLPDGVFAKVEWLSGAPAANVNLPFTGKFSNLKPGPEGISMGTVGLEAFGPIKSVLAPKTAAAVTSKGGAGNQPLSKKQKSTQTLNGVPYVEYTRSDPWTAKESTPKSGCLVSSGSSNFPEPGDLRLCFERSTTTKMSILAEANVFQIPGQDKPRITLVVSDKHLRTKVGLRVQTQGYRMREDQILSLDELLEEEKSSNETSLYMGRVCGPLILWAAFYCFLISVVNKIGNMLEDLPCVGRCMGVLADFVETLVTCLICAVSCCMGLACGLMAMAFAWIVFRPLYGIILLALSLAMFAAVGFFAYNQKGQKKVRRRSGARQSEVGQAVEMNATMAQPAPVQPAAVQPAVAVAAVTMFQVQCPQGVAPGSPILVMTPDGRQVQVQVPAGIAPGQMFQVQA